MVKIMGSLDIEAAIRNTKHSGNSANEQRVRLLQRLKLSPVDTITARRELDIMMPAARIFELRKQGEQIDTMRVRRPTEEGKLHSVALYVLLSEGSHE